MLLEHLRQYDEFVVHTLSELTLFRTVHGGIKKVLTLSLVNMGLRTKVLKELRMGR